MQRLPVIAIAGLACENSTFTPSRTLAAAFHPKRGAAIFEKHDFLQPGTFLADAAIWKGTLIGHALPGGIVERSSYESLVEEIVSRLFEICNSLDRPLDGLWFDIHGAMSVEGLDDVEYILLSQIREVIGPTTIVSASMDLHGNVSQDLLHQLDLVTCYRTAPHVDVRETRERACRNLLTVLGEKKGERPWKAWIPIPILLPGEMTSTRDEPAKSIYAAVTEVEKEDGVLDASVWVGYAWADEPRNRAVAVVTGYNLPTIITGAETLAKNFWSARHAFKFVAPTGSLSACLDKAATPNAGRPFFISDSGDNPTAGGSGDVTWSLQQILTRSDIARPDGPRLIYASIPAPQAIENVCAAGHGATITVTAGADVDDVHAGPVTFTGRVHAIKHNDPHARVEFVLHISNTNVFVILTQLRKPYHKEHDFTDLDLRPREADIVVVKIGYLEPELWDMARGGDWMLALTPGGVDQDLKRLGHRKIVRPMWPLDDEGSFGDVDLEARIVLMSDQVGG
ncbi:Microcystin LR degradation protein MlrC [Bimuria novae-zelandiae CBS 107.79]|uniref:Microcystin LR degradation protein MlrC n=1 Tax=Bimuria novae-zelandiae CBS 107.79 TaxID=1447943 RepID=A0A6A5UUG0_9PLEO|nr:Microcystin LR degradation protein MlrC [Bimuria novae-zelandiae CBS 107.79]